MSRTFKLPSDSEYERLKTDVALSFCPYIYPCGRCFRPVVSGFVCAFCGESNPQHAVPSDAKE